MLNLPSKSVMEAMVVPFTFTLTCGIPSLVCASVTVPFTVCCAKAEALNKRKNAMKRFFIERGFVRIENKEIPKQAEMRKVKIDVSASRITDSEKHADLENSEDSNGLTACAGYHRFSLFWRR